MPSSSLIEEAGARPDGRVVVKLAGRFDLGAAGALRGWLAGLAPGTLVTLEFGRVRDLEDRGLAALAASLARDARVAVTLAGLREHHLRLMRYCGFDAERPPPGDAASG